MTKLFASKILAATAISLCVSSSAVAGAYGDSLTQCLAKATTSTEKTTLVKWIFAMVSLHPQLSATATLTKEDRTNASKEAAAMLQKLLTKTCLNETREAMKFEGPNVLRASFNQLGQIAAKELFSNPAVAAGLAEYATFIDEKEMEAVFGKPK
jgi:hypothetical protein